MRKNRADGPGPAAPSGQPAQPQVPIPWTVNAAVAAVGVLVVCTLLHLLLARGFTTQLTHLLVHANATSKNPDKNYDAPKQLAEFRKGLLLQGVVVSAALAVLACVLATQRARSDDDERVRRDALDHDVDGAQRAALPGGADHPEDHDVVHMVPVPVPRGEHALAPEADPLERPL